eukprot:10342531-Prorocentrum_lima.AAC.1
MASPEKADGTTAFARRSLEIAWISLLTDCGGRQGNPWKRFAQHFPLFKMNRAYFDMSIQLPKSGKLEEREMTRFLQSSPTA